MLLSTRAIAMFRDERRVAVELELMETRIDGCGSCGCRTKRGLETGRPHEWWVSYGLVRAVTQGSWEAAVASSHCGSGSFSAIRSDFLRTLGIPYLILDLSTTLDLLPTGSLSLKMLMSVQKLSSIDGTGKPLYARSVESRTLSVATEGSMTFPLLIPDPREEDSFGVHEVLVQLRASLLGSESATLYGAISISADVAGSEVLLDGGFVGRTAEAKPTLLKNVLAGAREIRVRDFSGREASRDVVVEKDEMVEVALEVMNLKAAGAGRALVPIGENPQGFREYWRSMDGAIVVAVPAGEFLMGSPEGEGEPNERPQHRVHVPEFLIDKTEVTWRQFRKVAEAKGAPLPPAPIWRTPDDYAASNILWDEARQYCDWVGGRLPAEAEWEKAARGNDTGAYSWGNEWDPERCNSLDGGPHRPESAGSFPKCLSPYGVLDMAGGVWEWCSDRFQSYDPESSSRDPVGQASGTQRVLRGAAWISPYTWLRASFRYQGDPTWRNPTYGFRCAQDAPE